MSWMDYEVNLPGSVYLWDECRECGAQICSRMRDHHCALCAEPHLISRRGKRTYADVHALIRPLQDAPGFCGLAFPIKSLGLAPLHAARHIYALFSAYPEYRSDAWLPRLTIPLELPPELLGLPIFHQLAPCAPTRGVELKIATPPLAQLLYASMYRSFEVGDDPVTRLIDGKEKIRRANPGVKDLVNAFLDRFDQLVEPLCCEGIVIHRPEGDVRGTWLSPHGNGLEIGIDLSPSTPIPEVARRRATLWHRAVPYEDELRKRRC